MDVQTKPVSRTMPLNAACINPRVAPQNLHETVPTSSLRCFTAGMTKTALTRFALPSLALCGACLMLAPSSSSAQAAAPAALRVARFIGDAAVEVSSGGQHARLQPGDRIGTWTLMAISPTGASRHAVLEDFTRKDGDIVFVDGSGVTLELGKSLESTTADPQQLYLGHTKAQTLASAPDLLGNAILAKAGDPTYDEIAPVFAPITKVIADTYAFTGTPDTIEKMGFGYSGRSTNFDPATLYPPIRKIREAGHVWGGLVGGYLPALRFVYPDDAPDSWTELVVFSPFRIDNDNPRVQPVWYRVSRVEHGQLRWSRYVDSYRTFLHPGDADRNAFYADLATLKNRWDALLAPGMHIDVPDQRVGNMARASLVRAIMTRVNDYPKYGAVDKNYGGTEHDGFPDTFTVETAAMLDWGLVERAGRYIDNYFGQFVRDDGSILYRGPETGQYGRMLTVLAQYVDHGGDPALLLRYRKRIDAVTRILLDMRTKALTLPTSDPAHGMLAGWSEADSTLEDDPLRYVRPYFSNSTEAERGFRDLGRVWQDIGRADHDASLVQWGRHLSDESRALQQDIQTSISRSLFKVDGKPVIPAIAGVRETPYAAVQRDVNDPQFRAYRAYMEMMYSGNLMPDQVGMIVDYRSNHHDVLLGMPLAYTHAELAGFLSYGYGYGLIQTDRIREALLMMYSDMAHQYTRGQWMAPETRIPFTDAEAAPYCTPAQLVEAMMTRWLLLFEDPQTDTLWLGKALPRAWLEDGKTTRVTGASTRWGRLGFSIVSHLKSGVIDARIDYPHDGIAAETRLRLRAPDGAVLKSVTVDGKPWTRFDAAQETVTIPAGTAGTIMVVAHY